MTRYFLIYTFTIVAAALTAQPFSTGIRYLQADGEPTDQITELKRILTGVDIIGLGEPTHGMADVFRTRAELVKLLHEELGFDLLLMEVGYGDASLAYSRVRELTGEDLMQESSSYDYYKSDAMLPLYSYVRERADSERPLLLGGFDVQPQQDQLLAEVDTALALIRKYSRGKPLASKIREFNKLYEYDHGKDSIVFIEQHAASMAYLKTLEAYIIRNNVPLIRGGWKGDKIQRLANYIAHLRRSYADLKPGDLANFPQNVNYRDARMFATVEKICADHPGKKVILWAQNSHLQKQGGWGNETHWLGHLLHEKYGDGYYSLGTVVAAGQDRLHYDDHRIIEFNDTGEDFLAGRLLTYKTPSLIVDFRNPTPGIDFLEGEFKTTELGGQVNEYSPGTRFDGVLFLESTKAVVPR